MGDRRGKCEYLVSAGTPMAESCAPEEDHLRDSLPTRGRVSDGSSPFLGESGNCPPQVPVAPGSWLWAPPLPLPSRVIVRTSLNPNHLPNILILNTVRCQEVHMSRKCTCPEISSCWIIKAPPPG